MQTGELIHTAVTVHGISQLISHFDKTLSTQCTEKNMLMLE